MEGNIEKECEYMLNELIKTIPENYDGNNGQEKLDGDIIIESSIKKNISNAIKNRTASTNISVKKIWSKK